MNKLIVPMLIASLLLGACSHLPQRTAPAAPATPSASAPPSVESPTPNDNLNAVAWTQAAIERDLIYRQTYRDAGQQLARALADPAWDALPAEDRKTPLDAGLKPAVIVDIDETVLDNSPYQARLVVNNASYNESTWAQWCREERAAAVPGVVDFLKEATNRGITVFYLSNRASDLEQATLANLRKLALPIASDEQVFLGLGTVVPGCEQHGSEKGCRRQLIARKYRVLVQVGDQLGDFVNVTANTPQGRRDAVEPYLDWIGERWFVLPNPTYGSWEPALFNNDWRQPVQDRRRAKQAALRLN